MARSMLSLRHVLGFACEDCRAKPRIGIDISSAQPGSDDDLFYDLGEDLAPFGIGSTFLTFNGTPFGMSRHNFLASEG